MRLLDICDIESILLDTGNSFIRDNIISYRASSPIVSERKTLSSSSSKFEIEASKTPRRAATGHCKSRRRSTMSAMGYESLKYLCLHFGE